jgi:SagB-type dehydrogenase family enzyme
MKRTITYQVSLRQDLHKESKQRSRRLLPFQSIIVGLFLVALIPLSAQGQAEIELPSPMVEGSMSVEKALISRKTVRSYQEKPLDAKQVGQLLWASNGNMDLVDSTTSATKKVIPSAMRTYPLAVFLLIGKDTVKGLAAGVYAYIPARHTLKPLLMKDKRDDLAQAAFDQEWIRSAPMAIVICGGFDKVKEMTRKLGVNFAVMEAGNSDQNILLQATAMGLGSNTAAGFKASDVREALNLPKELTPLLIVTAGHY